MSDWHVLGPQEWQNHPLNRLRGGMLAVLGWISVQSVLALLIVVVLTSDPEALFDMRIPTVYNWLQWVFLAAGPPVVLALLFMRKSIGAVLYLVYFCGALLFPFVAEYWAPFLSAAETYQIGKGRFRAALFLIFTLIDIAALAYLFRSARANMVLRRREWVA